MGAREPLVGTAELVPLTLAQARRYVADHHRHNESPIGHRFSIGLSRDVWSALAIAVTYAEETPHDR